MAMHSGILAWRTTWTEEPGRLQSLGWQIVRHNWATSHNGTQIKKSPWIITEINLGVFCKWCAALIGIMWFFKTENNSWKMPESTKHKFPSTYMVVAFLKIQGIFSSVQFSRSAVSDSLQPHGLQHARPPCPSPTLVVYPAHVHWVGDAIQPSHPLSSPSPPAPNPSQPRGLFQWVTSSPEVAKVLEFQLQHQSFQWIFRVDFL